MRCARRFSQRKVGGVYREVRKAVTKAWGACMCVRDREREETSQIKTEVVS